MSREDNVVADRLAHIASWIEDALLPWEVETRIIKVLVIGPEVCVIGGNDLEWASDVIRYLDTGKLFEG